MKCHGVTRHPHKDARRGNCLSQRFAAHAHQLRPSPGALDCALRDERLPPCSALSSWPCSLAQPGYGSTRSYDVAGAAALVRSAAQCCADLGGDVFDRLCRTDKSAKAKSATPFPRMQAKGPRIASAGVTCHRQRCRHTLGAPGAALCPRARAQVGGGVEVAPGGFVKGNNASNRPPLACELPFSAPTADSVALRRRAALVGRCNAHTICSEFVYDRKPKRKKQDCTRPVDDKLSAPPDDFAVVAPCMRSAGQTKKYVGASGEAPVLQHVHAWLEEPHGHTHMRGRRGKSDEAARRKALRALTCSVSRAMPKLGAPPAGRAPPESYRTRGGAGARTGARRARPFPTPA
jgi:hypothetical protein